MTFGDDVSIRKEMPSKNIKHTLLIKAWECLLTWVEAACEWGRMVSVSSTEASATEISFTAREKDRSEHRICLKTRKGGTILSVYREREERADLEKNGSVSIWSFRSSRPQSFQIQDSQGGISVRLFQRRYLKAKSQYSWRDLPLTKFRCSTPWHIWGTRNEEDWGHLDAALPKLLRYVQKSQKRGHVRTSAHALMHTAREGFVLHIIHTDLVHAGAYAHFNACRSKGSNTRHHALNHIQRCSEFLYSSWGVGVKSILTARGEMIVRNCLDVDLTTA